MGAVAAAAALLAAAAQIAAAGAALLGALHGPAALWSRQALGMAAESQQAAAASQADEVHGAQMGRAGERALPPAAAAEAAKSLHPGASRVECPSLTLRVCHQEQDQARL